MIVYVVTRDERQAHNNERRTSVWNPFLSRERAIAMVESHVAFRVANEGATVQTRLATEPPVIADGHQVRCGGTEGKPMLIAAPQLTCSVYEVNLLQNAERTQYRVIQMPVEE